MHTKSGAALQVVSSAPPFRSELELWSGDGKDAHSLHYPVSWPVSFRPELPGYFINRYTRRGDVVLDPFCGGGTTTLEAALQGRLAIGIDTNPLAVRIAAAKASPADLTEVTLALQNVPLRRPVDLSVYRQVFAPFYDADTFRELVNLRGFLSERDDRVSRFVELVALSLLHGHSAGYFSVYSFPQVGLSPEEQEQLNCKRRQSPDYRSVVPRLLRKVASLLRDGVPSSLKGTHGRHHFARGEAADLAAVKSSSVDLVVTGPPLPREADTVKDLWLKFWFSGISSSGVGARALSADLPEWLDYMSSVILELARVVRGGGRAVFDLREIRLDGRLIRLDEEITTMVEHALGRYWDVEGIIVHKEKAVKVGSVSKERDPAKDLERSRMVVLRRR